MEARNRPGPEAVPVLGAASLTGAPVFSLRDEHLGRLEEIMIDLQSGRVAYAVLSLAPLGGMGDRLFPVPWGLLRHAQEENRYILQMGRERLKTAPGFERHDWPQMGDREWAREIHDFYCKRPYSEEIRSERRSDSPGRRSTDRVRDERARGGERIS